MGKKIKITVQDVVDQDNGNQSISQKVQSFDPSKFVTPETDKDTTYSAGDGISINKNNQISVTTKYTAGTGINITSSGVISTTGSDYVLPSATASVLGGVKIGSNITSSTGGVISIPNASSNTAGVTKLYTKLSDQTDGTLNLSVLSSLFESKLNTSDAAQTAKTLMVRAIKDCNSALDTGFYRLGDSLQNKPWTHTHYPNYMVVFNGALSGFSTNGVTQFAFDVTNNKFYTRVGTLGTSSVVTTDATTGSEVTTTVPIGNFKDWVPFVNELPTTVSSATYATSAGSASSAGIADSATKDGNGHTITSYYLTTSGTAASATSAGYASSAGSASSATNATTAGSCTGNAATASKWLNSRTIALSGHVTGSVAIDGSSNATIKTTLGAGTTLGASSYGYNATTGALASFPNDLANGIYYINPAYWDTTSSLTAAPYSVGSKAIMIQMDCGGYKARYLHFMGNCPYICYHATTGSTWPTTWNILQTLNVGKPSTAKKGALYLDIDNHAIMMYNGSNWVATRNP